MVSQGIIYPVSHCKMLCEYVPVAIQVQKLYFAVHTSATICSSFGKKEWCSVRDDIKRLQKL